MYAAAPDLTRDFLDSHKEPGSAARRRRRSALESPVMCGRYTLVNLAQLTDLFPWITDLPTPLAPRYNIAPSQPILAVANDKPDRYDHFLWGLIPSWAKEASIGNKLINARGETVAEKPSFRSALKRRRCLVIVDGWFEWKQSTKPKTPYLFRRKDGRPMAFAGLWEEWTAPDTGEVLRTCAVITTGPNRLMAPIHDRMPVILRPEAQAVWLRPEPQDAAELQPLLVPNEDEPLVAWEVGRVVNSPTNDVVACVERVASQPALL